MTPHMVAIMILTCVVSQMMVLERNERSLIMIIIHKMTTAADLMQGKPELISRTMKEMHVVTSLFKAFAADEKVLGMTNAMKEAVNIYDTEQPDLTSASST